MSSREIDWQGISGKTYHYWIHELNTLFKEVPGNYIFARETKPRTFTPIYIGQTSNLNERFENHHKMPCIRKNGATHIHTHTSSSTETARLAEEQDLINKWNTACNY